MTVRAPLVVGLRDARSVETIAWAADAAAMTGASVVVVHALPFQPLHDVALVWDAADDVADLTAWVDALVAPVFRTREVPYAVCVATGPPAGVLVGIAHAEHAAGIVVGVRERPWWRRGRRLATTLAAVAGRPVCTVPHGVDRVAAWLAHDCARSTFA